jgi:hypothetical protein
VAYTSHRISRKGKAFRTPIAMYILAIVVTAAAMIGILTWRVHRAYEKLVQILREEVDTSHAAQRGEKQRRACVQRCRDFT